MQSRTVDFQADNLLIMLNIRTAAGARTSIRMFF